MTDDRRPVGVALDSNARYVDRELSWLDFDARVLALAEPTPTPILERLKFCAIFSSNLDEYFQTRVAALKDRAEASAAARSVIEPQLHAIRVRSIELIAHQSALFRNRLVPDLAAAGYHLVRWSELDSSDRAYLESVFADRIFPVLTPLAVDPAHPFPYISNTSLNLAVVVRDPSTGDERFARVKVPPLLQRFIPLADGTRFVTLEDVIAAHLDTLFPGMVIVSHHAFRVTRDVEIELSDDSEDLLQAIELVLQRQTKFGRAVRVEVDASTPDAIVELLVDELEIAPHDVYRIDVPLDLTGLFELAALPRPDLHFPDYERQVPVEFRRDGHAIFDHIRSHDVLVHHPYDDFAATVEAFVAAAADDPGVVAIKQTLYRTGGDEEGIAESLARAALSGKQVVVLVELTARGDEQRNIERARMLEEAGVHVVYGIVGLKTHAKILLVVRREGDELRRYCHVGTGNYNPKTAQIYEDLGVFSADPDLNADVAELFNHLTGYSRPRDYRRFLVAPGELRPALLEHIAREARPGGRIIMKMNALVDLEMVDALYAASQAGADIDLIVRGICCLRPGVPGLSERIRVRSIIGRYLEHSRIYRFGADPLTADCFMGSADLMPRNLDRRVEALLSVVEPGLRARIDEVFSVLLTDDTLAWELTADTTWHPAETKHCRDAHHRFEVLAVERVEAAR